MLHIFHTMIIVASRLKPTMKSWLNGILAAMLSAALVSIFLGCGFKGSPYYGESSNARGFNDLSALESKIE